MGMWGCGDAAVRGCRVGGRICVYLVPWCLLLLLRRHSIAPRSTLIPPPSSLHPHPIARPSQSDNFNLFIIGCICLAGVLVGIQTYDDNEWVPMEDRSFFIFLEVRYDAELICCCDPSRSGTIVLSILAWYVPIICLSPLF